VTADSQALVTFLFHGLGNGNGIISDLNFNLSVGFKPNPLAFALLNASSGADGKATVTVHPSDSSLSSSGYISVSLPRQWKLHTIGTKLRIVMLEFHRMPWSLPLEELMVWHL